MAGKAARASKIQKMRARTASSKDERKSKQPSKSSRDEDNDMAHNSVVPDANGEHATKEPSVAPKTNIAKKDKTTIQEVGDTEPQLTPKATADKNPKKRRRRGKGSQERHWQKLQTRIANRNGTVGQHCQKETGHNGDVEMGQDGFGMAEDEAQEDRNDMSEMFLTGEMMKNPWLEKN